jgi:hypothetical protein
MKFPRVRNFISDPRSLERYFLFNFPAEYPISISQLSYAYCMPHSSHPPLFDSLTISCEEWINPSTSIFCANILVSYIVILHLLRLWQKTFIPTEKEWSCTFACFNLYAFRYITGREYTVTLNVASIPEFNRFLATSSLWIWFITSSS